MNGHGEKLTRKQEAAIALLTARTLEDAATKCGVALSTLKRWLTMPDFRRRYAEARGGVLERTTAQLLTASSKAVETLEACLDAPRIADSIRAARAILTHAQRSFEQLDLAEQLAELRQQVEELKREPRPYTPRSGPAPTGNGAAG